ncbi:hypothetical protein DFH09DRAFT_1117185 [Mycena vulgaris]|nr:hypothetical protein DFH09DRAFT_1117185 [Mycena vulgaris]
MPATRASTRSGAPLPKANQENTCTCKGEVNHQCSKASRAKPDPVSDKEEDDGPANDTLPEDALTPTEDDSVPLLEDVRHEDATTPTKDAPHRSVPPTKDTPHRSASPAEDLPRRPASPVEDRPRRSASSTEDAPSPSKFPSSCQRYWKEFELEFGLRSKTKPELGDESEDGVGDDGMRLSSGPSHPDNAPSQASPMMSPPRVDTLPASPRVEGSPIWSRGGPLRYLSLYWLKASSLLNRPVGSLVLLIDGIPFGSGFGLPP